MMTTLPATQPAAMAVPDQDQDQERRLQERRERMRIAKGLKALAEPTRLKILQILIEKRGTIPVEGITELLAQERIDLKQSSVSHNLKVLQEAELIELYAKASNYNYYVVRKDMLDKLFDAFKSYIGETRESQTQAENL
jgi:DNA-binding transcriptional ArsR family regulator